MLAVEMASKFSCALSLPLKQAEGVAGKLLQLCMTFGVPKFRRCDEGKELRAIVIQICAGGSKLTLGCWDQQTTVEHRKLRRDWSAGC